MSINSHHLDLSHGNMLTLTFYLSLLQVERQPGGLSGDMKLLLSHSLGVKGTVKKTRTLYMVGQTRVHVDKVEGLGDFMELEASRLFKLSK